MERPSLLELLRRPAPEALSTLHDLEPPPWRWPRLPGRWFAGGDAVALTCPNVAGDDHGGEAHLSVRVSALARDGIRFLEPHLTGGWDHYAPRDG